MNQSDLYCKLLIYMMDAIKNVENEVDRVLRLFTNCKDNCHSQIDQLLDLVDKSQKEIENLTTNGKY